MPSFFAAELDVSDMKRGDSNLTCYFCKSAPPIKDSHVVPNFMSKHIKKNSPFGNMLNLWSNKSKHDLHKGSYFCAKCDNEMISGWEGFFARKVWNNPLCADDQWGKEESLKFILSLAYRYAIHFLETSPISANHPYSNCVKNTTETAIRDNSIVGNGLYIYPYVHQAILQDCSLLPGVNHLLSLSAHGESLPKEGSLPNAFLVIVPKIVFLFCDGDLTKAKENTLSNPVYLMPGKDFHASTSNNDMPIFLSSIFNRLVNHGQSHQKQMGRWKKMAYGTDKLLNPNKMCYVAQNEDQLLLDWQRNKCR